MTAAPHREDGLQLGILTHDYLANVDLTDMCDIENLVGNLVTDVGRGWFLIWEGVAAAERGDVLTARQQDLVGDLISFSDADEEPILYINDCPRPRQRWYEIVLAIAPHLVVERISPAKHAGWIRRAVTRHLSAVVAAHRPREANTSLRSAKRSD